MLRMIALEYSPHIEPVSDNVNYVHILQVVPGFVRSVLTTLHTAPYHGISCSVGF